MIDNRVTNAAVYGRPFLLASGYSFGGLHHLAHVPHMQLKAAQFERRVRAKSCQVTSCFQLRQAGKDGLKLPRRLHHFWESAKKASFDLSYSKSDNHGGPLCTSTTRGRTLLPPSAVSTHSIFATPSSKAPGKSSSPIHLLPKSRPNAPLPPNDPRPTTSTNHFDRVARFSSHRATVAPAPTLALPPLAHPISQES